MVSGLLSACVSLNGSEPNIFVRDIPCTRTADCPSNQICRFPARVGPNLPATTGTCAVPTGACTSEMTVEQDCYPGARCVLGDVQSDAGVTVGGQCTFTPRSHQGFPVSERITLRRPMDNAVLGAVEDVSLQWDPPAAMRGVPTTTVAVVMDTVPVRVAERNQIANRTHIKWIWSSADPGGPVQDGVVPFIYGRRGVNADGTLGAPWTRGALPAGTYVWFVYSIANGEVMAASDVLRFTVMTPTPLPPLCLTTLDCVLPGEIPETVGCVSGRCRRRCASNYDCAAYGGTCDLETYVHDGARHGAYCLLPPGVPYGG